ncbi:MAG: phosphoribosyltransferase [Haloarculaceae archaeon]
MFDDRFDAGEQLADALQEAGVRPDIVLAIPRGGLPIGRVVADRFEAPLDVVVAKKVGAPSNPELAIGAVGSDGARWLNHDLIDRIGVDRRYVKRAVASERRNAGETETKYRGERPPLDLAGKRVLLVDDGVATGATTRACLRVIHDRGAAEIVLGVPVGPADTLAALRGEADAVIAVSTPSPFGAVGRFYRSFDQVTDEEAKSLLRAARRCSTE